jgi:hypothetical protein
MLHRSSIIGAATAHNRWITVGDKLYLLDGEGHVMPIQKDQPPPDPKYLQKYFNKATQ